MQYPIDAEKYIEALERLEGAASENTKNMFRIYIKDVNEAYEAGYAKGRKDAAK